MGDFDSVKIGVCDCYWTSPGAGSEVFLGLTKGGCELTYTPEWYDLSVDRYGTSPTDSALVGEAIAVKIPLAETDMNKIEMFSHTANVIEGMDSAKKLTFGRFPGFRLGEKAGRLRLHPVSMGLDRTEDVIIYKCVNKSPLNLNYKLDEERIFQTEFVGMIKRDHMSGAMLWEIGDSTIGDVGITLSQTLDVNGLPTNLQDMVYKSGGNMWITPGNADIETASEDEDLRSAYFKAYVEFGGRVYNVTNAVTFSFPTTTVDTMDYVQCYGVPVLKALPDDAPDYSIDAYHGADLATINAGGTRGKVLVQGWDTMELLTPTILKGDTDAFDPSDITDWRLATFGDTLQIPVKATWGPLVATATVDAFIAA